MNHEIENPFGVNMTVFYSVIKKDEGDDIYAMVYSVHPDRYEHKPETVAQIAMTKTSFGYLIQVMKMECEIKIASLIIDFFNEPENFQIPDETKAIDRIKTNIKAYFKGRGCDKSIEYGTILANVMEIIDNPKAAPL